MIDSASRTNAELLRGYGRLAVEAVAGVSGVVEAMHATIARVPAPLARVPAEPARGIAGLVYRTLRGITGVVGSTLDAALRMPLPGAGERAADAEPTLRAILNGVLGDHLADSDNPLAIAMELRRDGAALALERTALAAAFPHAGERVLVLVHGLCMHDGQWLRNGHDHGAALARDLGYTPVYLRYNSGRHVAANGREFAGLLEALLHAWPVPLRSLAILGHSMGGLVARSACHVAQQHGHAWLARLDHLVFLGTPHHGAPAERAGHGVDQLRRLSPYSAPLAALGAVRSAGITDLRHGTIHGPGVRAAARNAALPRGVRLGAIAATRARDGAGPVQDWIGDGLVPVRSALGDHPDSRRALRIPRARQWVARGAGHFDLLDDPRVYARIRRWLATGVATAA